jgi:hypothetical protein
MLARCKHLQLITWPCSGRCTEPRNISMCCLSCSVKSYRPRPGLHRKYLSRTKHLTWLHLDGRNIESSPALDSSAGLHSPSIESVPCCLRRSFLCLTAVVPEDENFASDAGCARAEELHEHQVYIAAKLYVPLLHQYQPCPWLSVESAYPV